MHLTLVTPPAVEPVSVEEFAADRRATFVGAEYEHAEQVLAAARGYVEQYTRRALIRQRLRVSTTGAWVACPVRLLRPPVIEVVSVSVDGEAVDASDYEWDGEGLWPMYGGRNAYPQQWITLGGYARRVVVEYWAGYGPEGTDVPAPLRQAILRIAGDLWESREDAVVGTVAGKVTVTAHALMDPYKIMLV